MKLNIYKDEMLSEVREVREVPRMKIPYRTADAVLDMVSDMDLENVDGEKVLALVLKNKQHLDTVVRATFGLDEEELAFIDIMELGDLAREIIGYVVDKMAEIGVGESYPNSSQQAQAHA